MPHETRRPLRRLLATFVTVLLGWLVLPVVPAQAVDAASRYAVTGDVAADGTLTVRATIDVEGAPAEVQQRFATSVTTTDHRQYRFTLSDVAATVGGQAVSPAVTTDGGYQVVTVPLQGKTGPVVLDYRVRGAALDSGDGTTTVNWRLLQGLNLPVRTFDAVLKTPGQFTSIDCYAGAPADPGTCGYYGGGTHEEPHPTFHDEGRGRGEVVGAVLRFPSSVVRANADVRTLWSLDRAFSAAPLPLALALGAAALGALAYALAYRRYGRDGVATAEPAAVGSFRPVGPGQSEFVVADGVRPGEVGTLADETVDPIDVTASVLDLAVRGHLVIEELPRASAFAPADWAFRRGAASGNLAPFEQTLLDAVAPAGASRRLSEAAPAIHAALPAVQSQLYDEVVREGWFARRPDAVRGRWSRLGWLALILAAVIAALLIAFTPYGLLALVLVGLAAAVGFVGQHMPARTPRGAALLAGLGVLRGTLLTQPTAEMPAGREHEELSHVLPYAVVLGGADRWLDGIAAVDNAAVEDDQELSWYRGPAGWRLADLPDSLRNFIRSFEGTLVAR